MRENRIIAALLGFICAVVMVLALKELKTIFIPLIFAVLLSIVLNPALKIMGKFKIPTAVSLTVLVLVVFLIFYLMGLVVYSGVASFTKGFPKYEANLQHTLETTLEKINLPMDEFQNYFKSINWQENLKKISIGSTISSTLGSFATFLGYVILILIFTLFLLSGQLNIASKLNKAFLSERARQISSIMRDIQKSVQTYLITKIFVSVMTAIVGVIFIVIFGVDFPIMAGVLFFALNFIPNIGSVVATLFPILICFVEYGYSWKVPGLAVCLVGTQMVFGNVIEPLLMGRGLNLSPLIVILSLIFWGWVWGIVGMVLAVPLTATLIIVCEHIESLKPLAILMSGAKTTHK